MTRVLLYLSLLGIGITVSAQEITPEELASERMKLRNFAFCSCLQSTYKEYSTLWKKDGSKQTYLSSAAYNRRAYEAMDRLSKKVCREDIKGYEATSMNIWKCLAFYESRELDSLVRSFDVDIDSASLSKVRHMRDVSNQNRIKRSLPEDLCSMTGKAADGDDLEYPPTFEFTGVLRLCYSLNRSGSNLPVIEGITESGADGKGYFYRVDDLCDYLYRAWGPPDTTGGLDAVRGKSGIIVFSDCNLNGATKHIALWSGDGCIQNCYWDECHLASLWILN